MSDTKKTLGLNRRRRVLLGVCAGYGDYFGIEPFFVRLAMIIAVFTWLPAALVYLISYFCMNKEGNGVSEIKSTVTNSKIARHLSNIDYKKRLHKNTHNRRIFGVCSGFSEYFETSPFLIRLALIGSLFFGPFGVFAYIAAAILMDKDSESKGRQHQHRPNFHHRANHSMNESMKAQFQKVDEYMNKRRKTKPSSRTQGHEPGQFDTEELNNCSDRFSKLEKKLRRLEATITSKKFRLHRELSRISES